MRTPVQLLENVSDALNVPVWIKREDLFSVHGVAGSKVRKLVKILKAAQAAGATDLVTAGTTGSHHVHAASVLGKAAGFRVHALLLPQPPLAYADGIHARTRAASADLTYVSGFLEFPAALLKVHAMLKRRGAKPYYILPGGSNREGVAAYREAGLELEENFMETGPPELDQQICVHGTGGMMAGLLLAAGEQTLPPVLGAAVYPFWSAMLPVRALCLLAGLTDGAASEFSVAAHWSEAKSSFRGRGRIDSRYMGAGYGTENPLCRPACDLFKKDGIFLDPVYMAKAGQLLMDQALSNPPPRGLLLWHTGPGLS